MEDTLRKIVLFNATDLVDNNPGCRSTMAGLRSLIKGHLYLELPLGFGYAETSKSLRQFGIFKKDKIIRSINRINNNQDFRWLLSPANVVIINAEGTIHSDSIGAITLLGFANLAINMNKTVYVVNGTFSDLSKPLLDILKKCNRVFVREKYSEKYLNKNDILCQTVLDCAFMTEISILSKTKEGILYTPGVRFNYGTKEDLSAAEIVLEKHFDELKQTYFKPTFLQIENKEKLLAIKWLQLGGEVLDSRKISVTDLISEISRFEIVVSGRYHILIFAILARVKIVPLTSNSFKIRGLLESLNDCLNFQIRDVFKDKLKLKKAYEFHLDDNLIKKSIVEKYSSIF